MFRNSTHRTMDMTQGPLFSQIFFFALPIMLSGILQLLFNAADTIVVGRFAGNEALAAVGSVGSLNNLIISLFIGLSVGANVLVARYTGSRNDDALRSSACRIPCFLQSHRRFLCSDRHCRCIRKQSDS